MKRLIPLLAVLLLSACAQQGLYYYGDYSQKYYHYVKFADENSRREYKESLENVFAKSARKEKPVPPGLYCDYAMLLLAEGNADGAREYLHKERAAWPEAAPFVDFLLLRHGLQH